MNLKTINALNALTTGMKLLGTPGIRRYIVIPLFINISLFSLMIYWATGQITELQAYIEGFLPSWLDFLSILIWPLFIIACLLVLVYGFTTIANIIASPFNALLLNKLEMELGYNTDAQDINLASEISKAILRELTKLKYNIKWLVLMLIFMFIPGFNIISIIAGAWMLAVEYLDYPAENAGLDFPSSLRLMKQNRLQAILFGGTISLLSMIPIINFLVVPASICGATPLWHEKLKLNM